MAKTVADCPELLRIWDYNNNPNPPEAYPKKSAEKVWWLCPECGYNWQTSVRGKKNDICPACTGTSKVVIPGRTDFASMYPELGEDYLQELNPGVKAETLGTGSHERLTWKCHVCGYTWKAPIYGRIRREKKPYRVAQCPACAGQVRTESFEDEYPELAKYYSEKNPLPLNAITSNWQAKYIWKCKKHGTYESTLASMIRSIKGGNTGCPFCNGNKVRKEDSFGARHPELVEEWASEKSPYEIAEHSKEKIQWKCKNGHEWEATPDTRAHGYGYCRECNPLPKKSRGVMDMFMASYHKYHGSKPLEQIPVTDTTEYEIECEKGHIYRDTPRNIYQRGKICCPVCEKRVIVSGVNDLQTLYPEYARMYGENDIPANEASPLSNNPNVNWECDKGHKFRRSIRMHIQWKGVCPVCSMHMLVPGVNDILSQYPQVKDIWDYEKNDKDPDGCLINLTKGYYYVCDRGHSYRSTMKSHIEHDYRCPVCNNFAIEKENPLTETDPELAKEWSPSNERDPDSYERSSVAVVKWICPDCKGEYRSRIIDRELGDCPFCANRRVLPGLNDLKTTHPDIAAEWFDERPADTVSKDMQYFANWKCPDCGGEYGRIVVRKSTGDCPYCNDQRVLPGINDLETKYPELAKEWSITNDRPASSVLKSSPRYAKWICPDCGGEYPASIKSREVGDDACPYCSEKQVLVGYNDLKTTDPETAKEYSKNNIRNIETISKGMSLYVLWICQICGGEYGGTVKDHKSEDCPYCAGRKIKSGYNDLATTNPELAKEWAVSNEKDSSEIGDWYASYAKWICPKCKNEYGYKINKRKVGDDSCPYCSGIKAVEGYNDLATTNPELAMEWSDSNERSVFTVTKTMWNYALWICSECGGEYTARICDREYNDDSCPYCAERRVLMGFNDLATTDPELAKEYSANNEISASRVMKKMKRAALWKCPTCGGEYSYSIADRELDDDSCPYCADRKVLPGYNDLETTDPELAKEYSANNEISASRVMKKMKRAALWKCPTCGGEYSYSIADRELDDDSCPYCADRKVLPGYNDLETMYPELKKEWMTIENELLGLNPRMEIKRSTKEAWWQCSICNYQYTMGINQRVHKLFRNQNACPYCNGRRQKRRFYI